VIANFDESGKMACAGWIIVTLLERHIHIPGRFGPRYGISEAAVKLGEWESSSSLCTTHVKLRLRGKIANKPRVIFFMS
jgi:hypothetical protein